MGESVKFSALWGCWQMQEVTLLFQSTKEHLVLHRSTQVMAAGLPHVPMRLLLFSLIIRSKWSNSVLLKSHIWNVSVSSGSAGSLLFADQRYDIIFPCEGDIVCLHMWRFLRDYYIAVATNGRIQTRSEMSGCRLPITDQTARTPLPRFCQKGTEVLIPQNGEGTVKTPGHPDIISAALYTHYNTFFCL